MTNIESKETQFKDPAITCFGHLTKYELRDEVESQKQMYALEWSTYPENKNDSMQVGKGFQCQVCQKIPLAQQCCTQCGQTTCQKCVRDIKIQNGLQICPSEQCQELKNPIKLHFENVSHKLKMLTENFKQKHSCYFESLDDPQSNQNKDYNIFDLYDHLQKDCPHNRTCKHCSIRFDTIQTFYNHLQYQCKGASLQCGKCSQKMIRQDYMNYDNHNCVADNLENLKLVIIAKEQEKMKTLKNAQIYARKNDLCIGCLSKMTELCESYYGGGGVFGGPSFSSSYSECSNCKKKGEVNSCSQKCGDTTKLCDTCLKDRKISE